MKKSRREFLKGALFTGGGLLLASCAPAATPSPTSAPASKPAEAAKPAEAPKPTAPAVISGAEISLLQWNHFIPTADPFFKQQAAEYSKQTGVKVTIETINGNDLLPKFTAAIQGQSGPTIFQLMSQQAHTLAEGLYDVTDLANEFEPWFGKWYPQLKADSLVGDKFRSIPWNMGSQAFVYRKSWFEKVGATVPDNWDQLRDAAKKVKAMGKPVGQAFGQSFADATQFCYPLIWSFGGKELEADNKTIAINSKETIEAVKYAVALWKDGLDERGLSWDDSSNNTAFLAEENAATLNGPSIYIVASGMINAKDKKPWSDDMDHFFTPKGPAGGPYIWGGTYSHAIPTYVKGKELDAAKDYLRYIYNPKQYDAWFAQNISYNGPGERMESHPIWNTLPKPLQIFKTHGRISRALGYAGQPSAKVAEVQAKFVIPNMFARAIRGQAAEDSVKQAETEMKQIFS